MSKSLLLYMIFMSILMLIMFLLMSNYLHPISMIILLIIYTMMVCLIMSMWSFNYMYSIITFLMMISGMLIIFLYFASLISNEQFKLNMNTYLLTNFIVNLAFMVYFMLNWTILTPPYPNTLTYNINSNESLMLHNLNNTPFNNLESIYLYPFNNLTFLCIMYLLLALFSIIKICSLKSMTLRKINN
uniref:NADH dehydrogenase subunit 6 n=1 Tax=Stenamma diecki TaxID=625352 RepID=UPI001FCD5FD8|nr:NADH dehydrogenase subunit 6 [Stenamma diecki]UNZ99532.1 NADH dehydrogenase subunit 6 [Stenamma diecki]